jgi:hypothetical protein
MILRGRDFFVIVRRARDIPSLGPPMPFVGTHTVLLKMAVGRSEAIFLAPYGELLRIKKVD